MCQGPSTLLGHVLLTWATSFESLAAPALAWTLYPCVLRLPSAFVDLSLVQKTMRTCSYFSKGIRSVTRMASSTIERANLWQFRPRYRTNEAYNSKLSLPTAGFRSGEILHGGNSPWGLHISMWVPYRNADGHSAKSQSPRDLRHGIENRRGVFKDSILNRGCFGSWWEK
jgi:hypothetical protein